MLTLQEQNQGASVTCTSTDSTTVSVNSSTCSSIDSFGGNLKLVPGKTATTSVTLQNTGTVNASSFTLTAGSCGQTPNGSPNGSATDLCSKLTATVTSSSGTLYSGTLAGMSTAPITLTPLAAGSSVTYTFAVTLPTGTASTYAGLLASMQLTWTQSS